MSDTEASIHTSDDLYTTQQAMRVLQRSERRVQQMCDRGELNCWHVEGRWAISKASVHAYLDEHGPGKPRARRQTAVDADQQVRELVSEIRRLERELGRLGGRLERMDEVESTLRDHLRRERERANRLERELAEERRALLELRAVLGVSEKEQGGDDG